MKNKIISSCMGCNLYCNQKPLLDHERQADIMWVGLSAKRVENILKDIPLQSNTNTGKLIADIEAKCFGLRFYKTNLVKCLPLNEKDKLRYPSTLECSSCFPNLLGEVHKVKPIIVFLLGSKVASFILGEFGIKPQKLSYSYEVFSYEGVWYIPIHHPSYISVYKRKEKDIYIQAIKSVIERLTIL